MIPAFKNWSVSKLLNFENCPKRYLHVDVLKEHPFQETEATKWGNRVHKELENRVAQQVPLPVHLAQLEPVVANIEQSYTEVHGELKLAINKEWQIVPYFDKSVWARGIIDLIAKRGDEALVVDYKTGKPGRDTTQLEFYGAVLVQAGIRAVESVYLWIKNTSYTRLVVDIAKAEPIRDALNRRVGVMDNAHQAQVFPAKPSKLCCWCPLLATCDEAAPFREQLQFIKGK